MRKVKHIESSQRCIFHRHGKVILIFIEEMQNLKHKDSCGKSENLSKIFFAEILLFDYDYEGKSSSSNGLLWISFIF